VRLSEAIMLVIFPNPSSKATRRCARNFSHNASSEWHNKILMYRLLGKVHSRFPTVFGKEKEISNEAINYLQEFADGSGPTAGYRAFAANKPNRGSFELFEPATVDGHQLAPGQYKLTWEGTGPDIEAMVLSQGKVVATGRLI
jgi:hypothetical protein